MWYTARCKLGMNHSYDVEQRSSGTFSHQSEKEKVEKTNLVVLNSSLEDQKTYFSFFAHPARKYNPEMIFVLPPSHPMVLSKEVLCFQIPSLLLSSAPFLQTDIARPKYPAFHHNSLCTELCLTKAFGECSWGLLVSPNSWIRLLWYSACIKAGI